MTAPPSSSDATCRLGRDGRPIGWDGFPDRLPRARYTRSTGHAAPLRQIAGQVRGAFGYTQGRVGPEGPAIIVLLPSWGEPRRSAAVRREGMPAPTRTPSHAPGGYTATVLDYLAALAHQDADLPPVRDIARQLTLLNVQVHAAFSNLHKAGHIQHWPVTPHRIIRLVASGAVLRTAGAPDTVPA